ncbi:hypothetical protein BD779DRAFT_586901 [Infundibulicybe gibba]|nr:hypothetical protein BD779DRAFT_586901 [Infundibulicybe gibba]
MTSKPVEKDVQAVLMKTRKCRRPIGTLTYPAKYSKAMQDYDHWDHLLRASHCRSLTMHQFDKPPSTVLDLGCGTGYWAMEAAKQWPGCTVVGYDVLHIQPDLRRFPDHCGLAGRISWEWGNLLDGLPFPPDTFDFVRIAGIGLGVPEDEWQLVLEEAGRVMKPGAVIEVIEEDLIFPCGVPPEQPNRKPVLAPIDVELTLDSPSIAMSMSNKSYFNVSNSTVSASPKSRFSSYSSQPCPPIPSRPSTPDPIIASQDHSRLKMAWDAMLSHNFLATNLLSVLPFYLSATFVNVQTHPAIRIPLPPNSPTAKSSPTAGPLSNNARSRGSASPFGLMPASNCWSAVAFDPSQQGIPSWSSMHLGKAMETVRACKDSLWLEYEKLGLGEDMPPVTRTTRAEDVLHALASKPSSRETFDSDWTNWERDMTDRLGMRSALMSTFGWPEPPGEKPDWRIWRTAIDKNASSTSLESSAASASSDDDVEICRAIKGFVCWKAPS